MTTTPTIEEVQKCDDPAQLNNWVAEIVKGWHLGYNKQTGHDDWFDSDDVFQRYANELAFDTNWSDAGPLLESLYENEVELEARTYKGRWQAVVWDKETSDRTIVNDAMLTHCVAKAAIISALMAGGES